MLLLKAYFGSSNTAPLTGIFAGKLFEIPSRCKLLFICHGKFCSCLVEVDPQIDYLVTGVNFW